MQYPDTSPTSLPHQTLIVVVAALLLFASPLVKAAKRLYRRWFGHRTTPDA